MRVANTLVLNEELPLQEQIRILQTSICKLYYLAQGRISFGTGVDGINGQNISGQWQEFTSDVTPDTEFSVTHTMDSVPLGYIIVWQDKAGSLYQGPTTGTDWTDTTIYLKCDVASVTFKVFLVKEGEVIKSSSSSSCSSSSSSSCRSSSSSSRSSSSSSSSCRSSSSSSSSSKSSSSSSSSCSSSSCSSSSSRSSSSSSSSKSSSSSSSCSSSSSSSCRSSSSSSSSRSSSSSSSSCRSSSSSSSSRSSSSSSSSDAGNDANTLLLLHCNGTDGSTTFTDSAASPNTITANGNAQIDTAQSKFGGASYLGDGSGDFLSFTPVYSAPGTAAWTFDGWFRSPSVSTEQALIGNYNGSATGSEFIVELFTSKLFLYNGSSGIITGSATFSNDTWYHIAIVREGSGSNQTKGYIDGTLDCTGTFPGNITATSWRVGDVGPLGGRSVNGWMDEVRWSNIARWTANFTPPNAQYAP